MSNRRVFYAIQQAGLAPCGTTTFLSGHVIHGLQSVGINTKFNLEQAFELGQLEIYQNIEAVPDIEVTVEKVLDGYALIYHLATPNAVGSDLVGRSNAMASFAMSIFSDSQAAASGSPLTTVYCSGMYVSQMSYTFPVEGNSMEQCTLVGNNKQWGTATFTGFSTNTDAPTAGTGISRRQHIVYAVASGNYTILPTEIEGISASGTNNRNADGSFSAAVQSIKLSANLGREAQHELGHKANYNRFVNWPVETRSDIEVIAKTGDATNAIEETDNLVNQHITVKSLEGIYIDMGTRNKLQQVSYGGGNAGSRGGNVHETYSYIGFNDFTVLHPNDPAGFGGY